jgi:alpha-tubulin suppressor-like RCC1 family protein
VSSVPDIAAIAAADLTSVALGADGSVWTWGSNGFGVLGDGSTDGFRYGPRAVVAAGSGIVGIAAGGNHVVACRADGTVVGWGSNRYGELGDGTTAPQSAIVQAEGLTSVTQVAAGEHHSLAIHIQPWVIRP